MDFLCLFETADGAGGMPGRGYGREEYELALKYISEAATKYQVFTSLVMPNLKNDAELEKKYGNMIRVDADTWRGDPFVELYQTVPSNWAKNVYDKGIRSSYEEIRSSGLRHNLFGERANGMMVPTQSMVHTSAMKLGKSGVTVNGGTIGGLDLMTIFTKDFWDKKGRNRRSRTLEVLKAYGDSTTVLLPEPIVH